MFWALSFVKGKMTLLAYPGASDTNFNGVNDNGVVVGSYNGILRRVMCFVQPYHRHVDGSQFSTSV